MNQLVFILSLLTLSTAWSNTATLQLRARAPLVCELSINDHGKFVSIINGENNFTIGSVSEACSTNRGFTLTISSQNGGVMVNQTGQTVPYTIRYDNSGVRSLANPVILNRNYRKQRWWTRSFRVNVPAQPNAVEGDYEDLITLTIAAN